jgi:hypothetical protein
VDDAGKERAGGRARQAISRHVLSPPLALQHPRFFKCVVFKTLPG